jgi:hypothetical protein
MAQFHVDCTEIREKVKAAAGREKRNGQRAKKTEISACFHCFFLIPLCYLLDTVSKVRQRGKEEAR